MCLFANAPCRLSYYARLSKPSDTYELLRKTPTCPRLSNSEFLVARKDSSYLTSSNGPKGGTPRSFLVQLASFLHSIYSKIPCGDARIKNVMVTINEHKFEGTMS
jgi:hypothetical protein